MKKLLLVGVIGSFAMADFTMVYDIGGNKEIIKYKDAKHVRIINSGNGQQSEQLVSGDKSYMVINAGGKKRYMDMQAMKATIGQMANAMGGASQEPTPKPKIKVLKKESGKKIAGIDCELWTIEATYNGKTEKVKAYVSNDKKLVSSVKAYAKVMQDMASGLGGNMNFEDMVMVKDGYAIVSTDGMKLEKFDTSDIDIKEFAVGGKVATNPLAGGATKVKVPPLCPLSGAHGKAVHLKPILKPKADGWKLIKSAKCLDMMKMSIENAIYKKGDSYMHISLSINSDEPGMIAKYLNNGMKIKNLKRGKIQGHRYQEGFLDMAGVNDMDIRLNNAMISITETNSNEPIDKFANAVLDLSKFKAVKKSKPTAEDALKMLGGSGAKMPSSKDMKKMQDMLKNMMGH